MLNEAGFTNVELVGKTGFNSSPVTKGVLLRAKKSAISDFGRVEVEPKNALSKYQEFFNAAYVEGTIDRKTKHLIALGPLLLPDATPERGTALQLQGNLAQRTKSSRRQWPSP